MKKILILAVVFISLNSCSSDDEINNNNKDPFIGSWYLFSIYGVEESDCVKKGTIIIKEDGQVINLPFYKDSNGNCVKEPEEKTSWKNKGNNIYSILKNGKDEDDRILTFSDNNNTVSTRKESSSRIIEVYKRK